MSLPERSYGGRWSEGTPVRTFNVVVHEDYWHTRWLRRHRVSWWAESDDVPGWFAAAPTRDDLLKLVMPGLRFHTNDNRLWFQVFYTYLPQSFDPPAAGRRAVDKHGEALRRLSE